MGILRDIVNFVCGKSKDEKSVRVHDFTVRHTGHDLLLTEVGNGYWKGFAFTDGESYGDFKEGEYLTVDFNEPFNDPSTTGVHDPDYRTFTIQTSERIAQDVYELSLLELDTAVDIE